MMIAPNLWVHRYRDGGARIRTGVGMGRRVTILTREQLVALLKALDRHATTAEPRT